MHGDVESFGRVALCVALTAVLVSALPAHAEPAAESERATLRWYAGEREELRWRPGLWTAPEIKRAKDRKARTPEWAWLWTANTAVGFDSNIFESPANESSSGVGDVGFRAEARRYFAGGDRLRLWGQLNTRQFFSASDPDAFVQRIGGQYRNDRSSRLSFRLEWEVKNENDNVVNTEGEDPLRDFAHLQYSVAPGLRYRISDRQTFWGFYNLRRRDFDEQATLSSLDWWWHGPTLRWRSVLGEKSDIEIDYDLRMQRYDEEPAELADGSTLASNPDERHRYHALEVESFFRPRDGLEWGFLYEFSRKDDRFMDFESWDNHRVGARLIWSERRMTYRVGASFDQREYDRRPGDGVSNLEYDRIIAEAAAGYAVSDNITAYLSVELSNRDTNRSTGLEFRDYDIVRVTAGVAVTY